MFEKFEKFQIVWLSVGLASGLIIAVKTGTSAISNDSITVTGSAYEIVQSDSGRMEFSINARRADKQQAYSVIKKQLPQIMDYLKLNGINDIDVKTVNGYNTYKYTPNGNMTNEIAYYNISQQIVVKSDDVQKIKEISTDTNI